MDRVRIGENFGPQPLWKVFIGVPLIYLPLIVSVPFVVICVWLVKAHLHLMGAKNIRSYWDFVPHWVSHRYRYRDQSIYSTGAKWHNLRHYRWYWIFNCTLECPLRVALFQPSHGLVRILRGQGLMLRPYCLLRFWSTRASKAAICGNPCPGSARRLRPPCRSAWAARRA